jgi:hypothetical protein
VLVALLADDLASIAIVNEKEMRHEMDDRRTYYHAWRATRCPANPGSSYAETIENLVKLREGLDDIHTNGFT